MTEIILHNLPKISLNNWYSGSHWTKRTKIKKQYTLLVKSQFKGVFSKDKKYEVKYCFGFKTRPLDASNTAAMIKLLEDIIFEDDSYKIVLKITIESRKTKTDFVRITVNEKAH